jgi:hypothetical protein
MRIRLLVWFDVRLYNIYCWIWILSWIEWGEFLSKFIADKRKDLVVILVFKWLRVSRKVPRLFSILGLVSLSWQSRLYSHMYMGFNLSWHSIDRLVTVSDSWTARVHLRNLARSWLHRIRMCNRHGPHFPLTFFLNSRFADWSLYCTFIWRIRVIVVSRTFELLSGVHFRNPWHRHRTTLVVSSQCFRVCCIVGIGLVLDAAELCNFVGFAYQHFCSVI